MLWFLNMSTNFLMLFIKRFTLITLPLNSIQHYTSDLHLTKRMHWKVKLCYYQGQDRKGNTASLWSSFLKNSLLEISHHVVKAHAESTCRCFNWHPQPRLPENSNIDHQTSEWARLQMIPVASQASIYLSQSWVEHRWFVPAEPCSDYWF